jgi:hydrogenase maturation protein HypF
MAGFALCPDCRREYDDPADRRFHAQPVACPVCGPMLTLRDGEGNTLAVGEGAVAEAAAILRDGKIVAAKGLGGFQLLCDARDEGAVGRLRDRKRREEKPFALMVADVESVRGLAVTDAAAEAEIESAAAPILLLRRRESARVAPNVAPGMATLGVMLPATPMHHLLLRAFDGPVVATSGNASDEPICTDENEALGRLAGIADAFLVHDRPIVRHADDSVAWVLRGQARVLRRARGYAPLPVSVPGSLPAVLAVGAHQKNAVALALGPRVFLGQHVGDLDTPQARAAFERCADDFLRLWDLRPDAVACDLHPDYASTRWAREAAEASGRLPAVPVVAVQHHHAHLASCLAENGVTGRALGVVWDGTGLGDDGTIWGGEFLVGDAAGYRRVAALRPFPLPGGDAAAREPRRVAFALLWVLGGGAIPVLPGFDDAERRVIAQQLERGVLTPQTSSMGRLFDAVAALAGIRLRCAFEGQAAMLLEAAATDVDAKPYPLPVVRGPARLELDWRPLVAEAAHDAARGAAARVVASRFHAALVGAIVEVARATAEPRVALTGGCFQNRTLVERAARALEAEGFDVLLHRHVPPNDGGIALGQAVVAARRLQEA